MNTFSAGEMGVSSPVLSEFAPLFEVISTQKAYFLRVANSILRHPEDAEDAVQAAYLSAWSAWSSFHSQSSVKTWLTSIVMNKALTELRRKKRRPITSFDDDPASLAEAEWQLSQGQWTPEQYAMREQTSRRVHALMAELPEQTQGVVVLRYMHEMSVDEIARAKGTTLGAVKSQLHRGCKAMRKEIQTVPRRSLAQLSSERSLVN